MSRPRKNVRIATETEATEYDMDELRAQVARAAQGVNVAEGDEIGVATLVKLLRENGTDTYIGVDYSEAESDAAYDIVHSVLKRNGIRDDDDYNEDYDDLGLSLLDSAYTNFNTHVALPSPVLVLSNDWFEQAEESSRDLRAEFDKSALGKAAAKSGFTDKQIQSVVNHAFQSGGAITIGVITDDYTEANGVEIKHEVEGTPVLVSLNYVAGDAEYVEAKGDTGIVSVKNCKDLADKIDNGKNSLGAIFGTRSWKY